MTELFRQSLAENRCNMTPLVNNRTRGEKGKNMKKFLFIFSLVLVLLLGGAAVWLCFFADAAAREAVAVSITGAWAWFEEEVLPEVLSSGAIIGVASVELIPVIRNFLKSKATFSDVARQVEDYTAARVEYDLRAEEREKAFYAKMAEIALACDARMEERDRELLEREAALERSLESFSEIARSFEERLTASEERLNRKLVHIDRNADKTERMVGLAFTNSGELVSKGVARQIAEVEHEDRE